MAVDLEQHEPLWRRHLGALIVGGFAVLLVVIVLLQLLEEGDIAEWLAEAPEEWAYVLCFLLVWIDAVIPIFPGETTLSTASTLAAQGSLELELVMLAGALGAIVGDSSLFWIARKSAAKVQGQLDKALENPKVRAGWDALDRSPGLLIVAGRYVPGMRFAVNATMGLSEHSLPPLPPLVGRRRNPVVGLHVHVGLQRCDHALRLSARVARHLLVHHVRLAGSDLLRRSAEKESGGGCRAGRCERGACGPAQLRRIRRVDESSTRHPTPASTIARASDSRPRLQAQERPAHGTCRSRSLSGQRNETGASRQAFSPVGSPTACSCGSCRSG